MLAAEPRPAIHVPVAACLAAEEQERVSKLKLGFAFAGMELHMGDTASTSGISGEDPDGASRGDSGPVPVGLLKDFPGEGGSDTSDEDSKELAAWLRQEEEKRSHATAATLDIALINRTFIAAEGEHAVVRVEPTKEPGGVTEPDPEPQAAVEAAQELAVSVVASVIRTVSADFAEQEQEPEPKPKPKPKRGMDKSDDTVVRRKPAWLVAGLQAVAAVQRHEVQLPDSLSGSRSRELELEPEPELELGPEPELGL